MLGTMAAAGSALAMTNTAHAEPSSDDANWKINRGRINQSVVHWCFKPMSVEDLARSAAALGI